MNQIILNEEYAGLSLMYAAIHGKKIKEKMPNPADEEQFVEDFNELYNNDEEPWTIN